MFVFIFDVLRCCEGFSIVFYCDMVGFFGIVYLQCQDFYFIFVFEYMFGYFMIGCQCCGKYKVDFILLQYVGGGIFYVSFWAVVGNQFEVESCLVVMGSLFGIVYVKFYVVCFVDGEGVLNCFSGWFGQCIYEFQFFVKIFFCCLL